MVLEEYGDILSGTLSFVTTIFLIIFFGGVVIGIIYFYLRQKRYSQFECRIWFKDAFGQIKEKKDSAGIFIDKKTHNKRFFIRKANVGLNPDKVPSIVKGGKNIVYLVQTGLKSFHFIQIDYAEPKLVLKVGEEDVNWAVNAYERQKKLFQHNVLMQYLPFIALAFVAIIILIMFIYLFKNMDVIAAAANSFNEATKSLGCGAGGTVIS